MPDQAVAFSLLVVVMLSLMSHRVVPILHSPFSRVLLFLRWHPPCKLFRILRCQFCFALLPFLYVRAMKIKELDGCLREFPGNMKSMHNDALFTSPYSCHTDERP